MKPELRKVKVYRGMSEETTAFTAQLWVDGEHIAYLKNDGRGGNNDIQHLFNDKGLNTRPEVVAFAKWCDEQPPTYGAANDASDAKTTSEPIAFHPNDFACTVISSESSGQMGADLYITLMLEDYEEEKQVKRWCKTKTVIRLHGDAKGDYHQFKKPYDPAFAARIREREGAKLLEIVNERYL